VTSDDFEELKPGCLMFPGVYTFQDEDGDYVYIGESKNVVMRLKQHAKKKWYSKKHAVKVLWVQDDEARLVAETAMILRHRPRANRAIKIGLAKDGHLFSIQFLRGKPGN